MRRIICILLILSFLDLSLFSCSHSEISSLKIVTSFEREFNTGGRIYSTLKAEGEEGYISADMAKALFPDGEPKVEYTLLMHSTLYTVSELCVFVCEDADERLLLEELAEQRLRLLASFIKDGSPFIYRKGNTVAYGFFPDAEGAKKVLKSVL